MCLIIEPGLHYFWTEMQKMQGITRAGLERKIFLPLIF